MSLSSTCPNMLDNAVLSAGFCAFDLAIDVGTPRSVVAVGPSDALVLDRSSSSVLHVFDSDNDGRPESKQTLATASGLNHGLALHGGYIYASSDTAVYRWPYTDATFSSIGDMAVVVENINADGTGGAPQGHTTRTLAFDDVGRLYISVGSYANVDQDSYRSRIRRFSLDDGLKQDFSTGEVFADGLRNEVGLAFDKHGGLWGVENGPDNLARSDLGDDIHNDNPAEELNRFREEDAGKHWGYPFCWTEYSLQEPPGLGRGTVWAWPDFLNIGQATDASCRADYVRPVLSMQAHSAPLGITFYNWIPPEALPSNAKTQMPPPFLLKWMDMPL
jgi:glucose/arabinose dehydrogenase